MWERTSSGPRGAERLRARRRKNRQRILFLSLFLFALVLAGIAYGLNQPAVRISHVMVYGGDPTLAQSATDAMRGSYLGIIPRDSVFFVPESRIRAQILSAHPDIAAISIFRAGLTALSIRIDERTAIARWCGLMPTPGVDPYCYVFDANGFVFAPFSSSTPTLNALTLYAPLEDNAFEPLRATVSGADDLPSTFDFARELAPLGSLATAVIIKNDEASVVLASGTRITYVLGQEQDAYAALISAKGKFNLADGSVEYVDLRFPGKVYVKNVSEAESSL